MLLTVVPLSTQEYRSVDVFTDAFNNWIIIQNTKVPGTIDAHEETIWKAVEKSFKRLDRDVKDYYEGP